MSSPYRISIVIRCYNEEQHIGRLLEGITQQSIPDVEIIIVDSGSTDTTVAIASRYPVKLLLIQAEEFSFGRSLNLGCQAATGNFIIIASAHIYPIYRDWLEKLIVPFADPRVAIVYGKQRGNEITKFSEHQIFARWFPEESNFNQDHPFCNNANAAIRRELWKQLPYDETLTGLEDLDWAKRAMQLGYKVVYSSEAEIAHVHNESLLRIYNRYRREAMAFKRIFPHEQFTLVNFTRLVIANILSDCANAIKDQNLVQFLLEIIGFRLMQFWGTYKGFKSSTITNQLKQTFYYPSPQQYRFNNEKNRTIKQNRVEYNNTAVDMQ